MSFYASGDQQVRLRFSRYTEEIIENDMLLFGETKKNTFLNKIIRNFYPDAKASISMRLEEYKNTLSEIIPSGVSKDDFRSASKTSGNKGARDQNREYNALHNAFEAFIDHEENRLLALAKSYGETGKGSESKPYRLQNEIYREFTDESSGFREDIYYKSSLSSYIKTLIEEYAHEPYIGREKIYFKENFERIEEAIAAKKQLRITVSNGVSFHTFPYEIQTDPFATAHYLTGYSYGIDQGKDSKYTVSYKIAAIRKIRIEKSRSGYLHPDEVSALLKDIAEKGVQFLASDCEEIQVRLTEQGWNSFRRWLHLRPAPSHIQEEAGFWLLTFHCSIYQARAYFFKFGAEAEVLSPAELRGEFAEGYQKAGEVYRESHETV